jgi:rod shape-determining protein MreC
LSHLSQSQKREADAQYKLGLQSQRALQVEQLTLENTRLRALLEMRERIVSPALAAQVLYDAADPYTRKVIIDKGALAAVAAGSPVADETGILGQVTRVYPLVSEVTLITDPNQAFPCSMSVPAPADWHLATATCAADSWSCGSWTPMSTCRSTIY